MTPGLPLVAAALLALGPAVAAGDSQRLDAPDPADVTEAVTQLSRAAEAQHVCYGWWLFDGSGGLVSVGSNLGAGMTADADPARCPSWLMVRATVDWTSESSESEDSATVEIVASTDLVAPSPDRLEGLGLDQGAFVDDPGWAVCQAATILPLLAAETGLAPPVPEATPAATAAAPEPLPAAGSDYWRSRGPVFAVAGWLVAGAGFCLLVGVLKGRAAR